MNFRVVNCSNPFPDQITFIDDIRDDYVMIPEFEIFQVRNSKRYDELYYSMGYGPCYTPYPYHYSDALFFNSGEEAYTFYEKEDKYHVSLKNYVDM